MRHKLTEQSWYEIMIDLIQTALYEDKPNNGDNKDENTNDTRDTDCDNALQ